MVTTRLDEHEVRLLIAALRYWRTHRDARVIRRTDPPLAPDTIDLLLAKLASTAGLRAALDEAPDDAESDRPGRSLLNNG
jgi:hypothetical protein